MSKHIVYVHGWGCSPAYWSALAGALPVHQAHFVDMRFFGEESLAIPDGNALYITHSLGTMWALKYCADKMDGLISFGGFGRFDRFASVEALEGMKASLLEKQAEYMDGFWEFANINPVPEGRDCLNIPRLVQGLDWLKDWNMSAELAALDCPVMALAGDKDLLTPLSGMKKEWAGRDLRVCHGGGHSLVQTHMDWCVEQIKDFLV